MKRVTAYCRVSTDKDDQLHSLESQEEYFSAYISANPDWEYIPLYADEGLSGTSTKKRKKFNQMIADAQAGKFDLILTKEVSRFARNAKDTLLYAQELKQIGVGIIFTLDNIDSLNPNDEVRLGIMATLAQEESRRTSDRVKWGQQRSMEKGIVFGHTLLGYVIENGEITGVNPSEASTVRLIFHKYLVESKGLSTIAKELMDEGILTSYRKKRWDATAVQRILKNEKYCGDLKQKKFITPNYLTHQTKRNKGEEKFIEAADHHEPIVSREVFDRTQVEIMRRGAMGKKNKRYSNRYAFSGKLTCGLCGDSFVSSNTNKINQRDQTRRVIRRWRCDRNRLYGSKEKDPPNGCDNTTVRNEVLERAFQLAIREAIHNKEVIISDLIKLLTSVLDSDQLSSDYDDAVQEIERLTHRIDKMVDLGIDGLITKEELKSRRESIDKQIAALQKSIAQMNNNTPLINERDKLMDAIKKRVACIVYSETFSDEVVKETLDRIVVYGKNRFDVHLRSATEDFF